MLSAIRQAVECVRRRLDPLRTRRLAVMRILTPPNIRNKALLRLEELEARLTPADIQVTNLADMPVSQTPPNMVTLRSALSTAGVTSITFAPTLSGNINLYTSLPTLNGVTINNTTGNSIGVMGSFNFGLVQTAAGTTNEIDNLELMQGGGVDDGGGILNLGSLTLNGCYISLCIANASGGAIANGPRATLTLQNTTLYQNTAEVGGGIANASGGVVDIYSGSAIESNSSAEGGGISNAGELTINGAVVKYNGSSDLGGGIYSEGTVTMMNTDIEYNKATNGGGGFYLASSGSLMLTYCTLSNNTSPVGAGGAWKTGSSYINNGGNNITDPVVQVP